MRVAGCQQRGWRHAQSITSSVVGGGCAAAARRSAHFVSQSCKRIGNRSFKEKVLTHSHTQTPTEQGRRGQARQTHEVFRTRPTRRASKRACAEHVSKGLVTQTDTSAFRRRLTPGKYLSAVCPFRASVHHVAVVHVLGMHAPVLHVPQPARRLG